jgi:quinol monooxygenase YgiN
MIRVIATIELVAGRRDEFLEIFHVLVPKVRAERGCLDYRPMVDLTTNISAQQPVRADVVTIVEAWETLDALESHLMAPHMLDYRKAVKDLVQNVALLVLQPA